MGLKKFYNLCAIYPYVFNSKEFNSNQTGAQYQIKGAFNCNVFKVAYLLSCLKCKKKYVVQTGRRFVDRLKEHLYNIQTQKEVIGEHFCVCNHSTSDLQAQTIEKVMTNTPQFRLERGFVDEVTGNKITLWLKQK